MMLPGALVSMHTIVQWIRCRRCGLIEVLSQRNLVMTTAELIRETAIAPANAHNIDMKLEVVIIPVSDVDRAKRFYADLGWRLDADFDKGEAFRGVQVTPPGSSCSIHFGRGITSAA